MEHEFDLVPHPDGPVMEGPLLLVIMDGVGLYRGRAEGYPANAFDIASTPNLDQLFHDASVFLELCAHGPCVGMPSESDMGNSEVGHNALGAGRVYEQGAALVAAAISSGALFAGRVWQKITSHVVANRSTLHFLGLLSDGNVHSHIDHLLAMLRHAADDGVARIRVHPLADGRDVDPQTYHLFVASLEEVLAELRTRGVDALVASGGGRMVVTMDRYNANWGMVERGWKLHVHGEGRCFRTAAAAIETLRGEKPGIIDQDLPPFVIVDESGDAVGPMEDGDGVIFFNFRGDRAIEISRAFTEERFAQFDRGRVPKVCYAGMMEYDGDLAIPPQYLVSPPAISHTVSEYLARNGVRQLAVAETQKFGHVTYFWNGNNSEKFDAALEEWVEVLSDVVPFETAPDMKAREVTEVVLAALDKGEHRFIRVNYANGDMVGHTGDLDAAVQAMETVDECVGRLREAVQARRGAFVVTADHGNLDMMLEVDKSSGEIKRDAQGQPVVKTSHTLSSVPWALIGDGTEVFHAATGIARPGLGHVAATLLRLLGFVAPPDYLPPLIR